MKHLQVACGIIEKDGKLFAAQRSASMSLPLKWEFPGGKLRETERPDECLKRELLEELGIEVTVGHQLPSITYRYAAMEVTLYPFFCRISKGQITLHEHAACYWLHPDELPNLDWADADWALIENCQREIQGRSRKTNDSVFR